MKKISFKLTLIILEIALVPIFFLGYVSFSNSTKQITGQILNQLDALAEIQKSRFENRNNENLERLNLLTSRTQLRIETQNFNSEPNQASRDKIKTILDDAIKNIGSFFSISVADPQGRVIASTDQDENNKDLSNEEYFKEGFKANEVSHFTKDAQGKAILVLAGPLILNGQTVGVLTVVSDGSNIFSVVGNYTGLGQTGETLLVKTQGANTVFLTPTRSNPDGALTQTVSNDNTVPAVLAARGQEGIYTDLKDYKDTPVFAATRYLPSVRWGVVAKIDQAEALGPVKKLKNLLLFICFFASFLVVLITYAIARSITRPIVQLTLAANKISEGDFDQEFKIESHDEIGRLGQSFSVMTKKLKESYEDLEKKVRLRTLELSEKLEELQDSKTASLNILEDLQLAKTKIEEEKAKDEALIVSIGEGMVAIDENGKIQLLNGQASQLLGYTDTEMLGQPFDKFLNMQTEAGVSVPLEQRPFIKATQTGKQIYSVYYYVRKDGSRFPAAITVAPIVNRGKISGAIETFRDITEEMQIDKAKTEFVSLASHQLRTPLTSINWYAEMLLAGDAGKLNPEQQEFIQEMYEGNLRMVSLVNSLLNVSRVDLGTFAIEPEDFNLVQTTDSVLRELQRQIDEKHLKIKKNYAENLPIIQADQKLMRMIIQNLLSNAVKYTPNQGAVTISLSKDQQNLQITVTDTGYGIPKNQQNKIFTKLFRADNAKEIDNDGNGLGLYLVKSIMDEVGGKVWFESEEHKGSTFYAIIPLSGMKKKTGSKSLDV